jgi:hypothetical protein
MKVEQQQWLHFILELDDMSHADDTYVKFDTFPNSSKVPLTNFKARSAFCFTSILNRMIFSSQIFISTGMQH